MMKKSKISKKFTIFSVCFFLFVFMTFTVGAAEKPQYGGTLRLITHIDGENIGYPPRIRRPNSQYQAFAAVETLVRMDKAGRIVPWLATSLKGDSMAATYTLTLRKGVKFHDGTDFNAEAVKWNLDRHIHHKSGGSAAIKSVDIIDDYAVRVNLKKWDSTLAANMSQVLGMIISPAAYKKNGEEWCRANPVGTGPFTFVSWEKDKKMVFKKAPNYWQKGKPYLDRIEWYPIIDSLTRMMSFKSGEADMVFRLHEKDLKDIEKEGFIVSRGPLGQGAVGIVPNSRNPEEPWADVRVRRAAAYAIDNKAIVKTIYFGQAIVTNQFAAPGAYGYNPNVVGYPYNPAKAKKLLKEAGYAKGFKTKLNATKSYVSFGTTIQAYLGAVGIQVDLQPQQTAAFIKECCRGGGWKGLTRGVTTSRPDVASAIAVAFSGGDRYTKDMLAPDDYVQAINNAISAPDFETKKKWVHKVQKMMIDEYCLNIPIVARFNTVASNSNVHDHNFFTVASDTNWTPEDVWMSKK
ncbi:ABC transporter substrate-binding protein [Thermodesulfobacteriota bacterium]